MKNISENVAAHSIMPRLSLYVYIRIKVKLETMSMRDRKKIEVYVHSMAALEGSACFSVADLLLGLLRKKPDLIKETALRIVDSILDSEPDRRVKLGSLAGYLATKNLELGRSIVAKLADCSELSDFYIRRHAIEALGNIGSVNPYIVADHVPRLIELLDDDIASDNAAYALACIAGENPDLVKDGIPKLINVLLVSENPITQVGVARVLGKIGSKEPELITKAVPKMISLLKTGISDGSHVTILGEESKEIKRGFVAQALGEIGLGNPELVKDAVPFLIKLLKSPIDYVRALAAEALGNIGGVNPEFVSEAVPNLKKLIEDSKIMVKGKAVEALGDIGSKNPKLIADLIPSIVTMLDDPDVDLRGKAAVALGCIGWNRPDMVSKAIPKLISMLDDPEEAARECAADAIGSLGAKNPELVSEALPKLVMLLNDVSLPGSYIQAWVAEALGNLAPVLRKNLEASKTVVLKLVEMLSNHDPFIRICAVEALGKIGDPVSLKPLKKLLDEESEKSLTWKRGKWIKVKDSIIEAVERIERGK